MKDRLFVTLDFDGTITAEDITDAVIETFARPGWEKYEALWKEGLIGSRECLENQMALIDSPLDSVLEHVDRFTIDKAFNDFLTLLKQFHIPFAIVSDGFRIFIERLLRNTGLEGLPVYANQLKEENGKLDVIYPHSFEGCSSGLCKCEVTRKISGGRSIIHIGDGMSDFCVSKKAAYAFAKEKLAGFCKNNGIPYVHFRDFKDIENIFSALLRRMDATMTQGDTDSRLQESIYEIRRVD